MRTTKKQLREGEASIDDMRDDLAEREAMDMDVGDIIDMLLHGVHTPLEDAPDIEIREEWEQTFRRHEQ